MNNIEVPFFGCFFRVEAKKALLIILSFDCVILAATLAAGIIFLLSGIITFPGITTTNAEFNAYLMYVGIALTAVAVINISLLIPTIVYAVKGTYKVIMKIYLIIKIIFCILGFLLCCAGIAIIVILFFVAAPFLEMLEENETFNAAKTWLETIHTAFLAIFCFGVVYAILNMIWSSTISKSLFYYKNGLFEKIEVENRDGDFVKAEAHIPINIHHMEDVPTQQVSENIWTKIGQQSSNQNMNDGTELQNLDEATSANR